MQQQPSHVDVVPRVAIGSELVRKSIVLGMQDGCLPERIQQATPATNSLDPQAGIAKAQECPGHVKFATTPTYDHRKSRPEDRPTP